MNILINTIRKLIDGIDWFNKQLEDPVVNICAVLLFIASIVPIILIAAAVNHLLFPF